MSLSLVIHAADEWADAVASDLVERLRAEPRLRLCLPTGETPAPLYAALVRQADAYLWSQATVVLLDDYIGLLADDPASGGPRLRRELIDHVRPAAFHAVNVDGEPDVAARELDAVAAEGGLDLTLLGLGLNGHIGLNEPASTAESPTRVVELEARSQAVAAGYGASHAPTQGITLGMSRLLESREIWLLVTGDRKAEILARALEGPEASDVPASFLRRHRTLRVIADEPAARLLRDTTPV